jgi:hypothetical protein
MRMVQLFRGLLSKTASNMFLAFGLATIAILSFSMIWAPSYFFALSQIFGLGLAMMGLIFLSSNFYKMIYPLYVDVTETVISY